jgi:hypothetical protein
MIFLKKRNLKFFMAKENRLRLNPPPPMLGQNRDQYDDGWIVVDNASDGKAQQIATINMFDNHYNKEGKLVLPPWESDTSGLPPPPLPPWPAETKTKVRVVERAPKMLDPHRPLPALPKSQPIVPVNIGIGTLLARGIHEIFSAPKKRIVKKRRTRRASSAKLIQIKGRN